MNNITQKLVIEFYTIVAFIATFERVMKMYNSKKKVVTGN